MLVWIRDIARSLVCWTCWASALAFCAGASPPTPTTGPTTRPVRRRVVVTAPVVVKPPNSIPGLISQQQTRDRIRSIYASDYADPSYAARRALANRLIDAAAATKRDFDAKFVLLAEARDLAAQVGDVPTAFDAIDRLAEAFPVIKLHERMDALKSAASAINAAAASLAVSSIALDLSDQCVIEGDYASADEMLCLASAAAQRGKSRAMLAWIDSRAAGVRPLKAAYEIAHPAELTLSRWPDDPESNLVMGRFVAFVKRDFDAGLLMLAKGSDPDLARLADEDLCTTEQPSIQLKTADAWWRVADERGGDDRRVMRERAGFWYAKAAPNLDGLDRALAERRLLELTPPKRPKEKTPRPPDAIRLNGHTYRVHAAEVSWEVARRMCEEAGGHLVCIETRYENDLMVKLARGRSLWLGAAAGPNAHWQWINKADFFFIYWSAGEPSLLTPEAHPLTTSTGAWKTSSGSAGFICEWDD